MRYPVIPTRGVIVFPGFSSKLIAGRTLSLNAISNSIKNIETKLVLVSQKKPIRDEIKNGKDLYDVGTLVKIKVSKELQDPASKEIEVLGLERVKVKKFYFQGKDFIEADVTIIKSELASVSQTNTILKKIYGILNGMINNNNFPDPKILGTNMQITNFADMICHYIPVNFKKKQTLLEELNVVERLKLIEKFIIEKKYSSMVDRDIDNNVRQALDSQQREFLLREKLKAIKQELGDISSKGNEVDEWNKMLKKDIYPKDVREKLQEEIKRYESMPPISAEAHVLKGYIDWVIKLPWKTYSKDNQNLNEARKILDKYHFGLKKVKERIIEHLAVKINTQSISSPIIALIGPPGVGKTSLAKSIAEAVNRKFVKVSLGGVRDEAEIRGHRRTYVGALPGKIIQAINKVKVSNPVILLDEVDKMSSDFKGDPTSALLEVLDPEQNKKFQDHYIEVEYDLSQIMFIATANYYDHIPTPLKDRVETIFLHQYTSEEKLSIAKDYIIPRIIQEHGLTKKMFNIGEDVIAYIIDKYTLEAGVRDLQRTLAKLARKIVLQKVEKKIKKDFVITKKEIKNLLGKEKIHKDKLKGKAEIGLVNGMYYSSVGGGVLPIEVTTYKAKNGGVKLTGQIQDVMQESLKIAIGYIRSKEKEFGIHFDWDNTSIQVHVPEGAMPKDGPSAGIAFATSVLSALLKKPIAKEVALTGEITLRGKILPIGGLKEKTLGAVEAGVRTIFIPKVNKKDLEDLSKKVKDVAKIILVEDYKEVYKSLF